MPTRAERLAALKGKPVAVNKPSKLPPPTPPKKAKREIHPVEAEEEQEEAADLNEGRRVLFGTDWRVGADRYNLILENRRAVVRNDDDGEPYSVMQWKPVGYYSSLENIAAVIAKASTREAIKASTTVMELAEKVSQFAAEVEIHLMEITKEEELAHLKAHVEKARPANQARSSEEDGQRAASTATVKAKAKRAKAG